LPNGIVHTTIIFLANENLSLNFLPNQNFPCPHQDQGWCREREKIDEQEPRVVLAERKLIGRNRVNLIVGWCGQFLFFVVLRPFSQVVGEWLENQILIPDWTYFFCPGTTLAGTA